VWRSASRAWVVSGSRKVPQHLNSFFLFVFVRTKWWLGSRVLFPGAVEKSGLERGSDSRVKVFWLWRVEVSEYDNWDGV
jgi:hypothetical protein